MKKKCVCLYSGGLDSRLILRLMLRLNTRVVAYHGVHSFESRELLQNMGAKVEEECRSLGAEEVVIRDQTQEILRLLSDNKYGLGKNLNPCTDCRINTVRNGFEVMREVGADFVCSGEVVGQRPKSQQRHTMNCVANQAKAFGGDGLLLRPLSAKLLEETVPEREGWVDREKLYDFSGRSRHNQMLLAEELGIGEYPAPAGGCLLTDIGYSARLYELLKYESLPDNNNLELLKFGRHYRTASGAKIVSARNGDEGDIIESLAREGDTLYISDPLPGALILLRGKVTEEAERIACGLAAYYSKYRGEGGAQILKYAALQSQSEAMPMGRCVVVEPEIIADIIVGNEAYLAGKKQRNDYGRR